MQHNAKLRFMEKEQLLSELKVKVGTTALSERTLDEYVTRILPSITSDEMVNDSFWDVHTSILKSFEGNLNHVVATKVKELKAEYEKAKPKDDVTPPPTSDEKYETLLKEVESLKKANEESLKKSAIESLRKKIVEQGDSLNVSNKNLWNDCVGAMNIEDGKDVEELTNIAKRNYEARLKAYIGDSAVPYGGATALQRVSEETANAKREAFKNKMRSQGKLPK